LYAISVPPSMVRLKIRQDFERNRHIDNLDVINMLLHKNQQEYQETMNQWKQEVSFGRVSKGICASGFALCPFGMDVVLRLECHLGCLCRRSTSKVARVVHGQESEADGGDGSTRRYDSSSLSSLLQSLTLLLPNDPSLLPCTNSTLHLCTSAALLARQRDPSPAHSGTHHLPTARDDH